MALIVAGAVLLPVVALTGTSQAAPLEHGVHVTSFKAHWAKIKKRSYRFLINAFRSVKMIDFHEVKHRVSQTVDERIPLVLVNTRSTKEKQTFYFVKTFYQDEDRADGGRRGAVIEGPSDTAKINDIENDTEWKAAGEKFGWTETSPIYFARHPSAVAARFHEPLLISMDTAIGLALAVPLRTKITVSSATPGLPDLTLYKLSKEVVEVFHGTEFRERIPFNPRATGFTPRESLGFDRAKSYVWENGSTALLLAPEINQERRHDIYKVTVTPNAESPRENGVRDDRL